MGLFTIGQSRDSNCRLWRSSRVEGTKAPPDDCAPIAYRKSDVVTQADGNRMLYVMYNVPFTRVDRRADGRLVCTKHYKHQRAYRALVDVVRMIEKRETHDVSH